MAIKIINDDPNKTYRMTCKCGCCYEYEREDIVWENGYPGVVCPQCHEFNDVMDERGLDDIYPTLDTIKYPMHFYAGKGVSVDNDRINEMVQRVAKWLKEHPTDWSYCSTGEITIIGLPWEDEFEFLIAKNVESCLIDR